MRVKAKNYKFIFQLTENSLKVIKCLYKDKLKGEIIEEETESILGLTDEQISERLKRVFRELQLNKESIIVVLPRDQATIRYLKVPSQEIPEIEKILSLQVWRFLPYPKEELLSGFSLLNKDAKGFSSVNLIICHQDIVKRYLRILSGFETQVEAVILSSYGLWNWYRYLAQKDFLEPVIIIYLESSYIEIAILKKENLLFSRSFHPPQDRSFWTEKLVAEINLTKDTYLKEAINSEPKGIILTGKLKELKELGQGLTKSTNLPLEVISDEPLVGLCEFKPLESLNLLPLSIKERRRKLFLRKRYIKMGILFFASLLIFSLGTAINFYHKFSYLDKLKLELNRISSEAKEIEEMKKLSDMVNLQLLKKKKSVDIIYELYRLIPQDISLLTLIYDAEKEIILRGRSPELSTIFKFIPVLEKSELFKHPKVRYATKRRTSIGEAIDFEIACGLKLK